MSDAQIKVHKAALVAIARWLTALCTPNIRVIESKELQTEIVVRFICANVLGMEVCVEHLTRKLIDMSGKMPFDARQVTALVRSCMGEGMGFWGFGGFWWGSW
jgi:hypothetical protein